jgi:hypothetical protein
MYFQFLIEDMSGGILVEQVMKKLISQDMNVDYKCKTFHGIGGFSKQWSPKNAKTQKLLNDLPAYLRGFNKSLNVPGYEAALIIVLDNDRNDPQQFYQELEEVAQEQMISIDHVFCIAVEEMEAWLFGDKAALLAAYPNARTNILNEYEQDSICGTWEKLANAIYPGGISKFRKDCRTYQEIGKKKCEWAQNIGSKMSIHENTSPSFQYFVQAIESRIHTQP